MYLNLILISLVTISCEANRICGSAFCNKSKDQIDCKFQLEGPARHCINYEKTIKSESDKELVLDKINSRRNKVAAGEIRSLRPAENMMKLHWNDELALSAQTWADQCVEHSIPDVQDMCKDKRNNASVGQNIGTIYGESPGLTPMTLVDLWYIELLDVNSSLIPNYQRSSATGSNHYDYFTQLMWAETSQVGCGAVKFKEQTKEEGNKTRTVYRLVCNFSPAGNQEGRPVFAVGLPCSRCPSNGTCDAVYKSLCAQDIINKINSKQDDNSFKQLAPVTFIPHFKPKYLSVTKSNISNLTNVSQNSTGIAPVPEQNLDYDENIYDFFSDLLDYTTKPSTHNFNNTTICKEVLVVDDLFNLLKKKLSNDETLRELLLTSKPPQKSESTDEAFTDPSVAAIMSRIYVSKESTTTTKSTDNEYLNSTLLVDLVEAVIFRKNDKISTSDVIELSTQSSLVIKPIKIQAELGEIKANSDFTGHYFFPEDNNEPPSSDQTDDYYDTSDIPVSDVAFEIEDLRRNKGTKDFLEEILESDFITETVSRTQNNEFSSHIVKEDNKTATQYTYSKIRNRRRNNNITFVKKHESNKERARRRSLDSFISYSDLLRKLAADLKLLKLNNQFHCCKNNSVQQILNMNNFLIFGSYCLYIKLNNSM